MSAEEQIKAAIVVFGDKIAIASPELNEATKLACYKLNHFVDYIQTLAPELERYQAITMASAVLESLPTFLEADPDLIDGLKAQCQALRNKR